MTKHLLLPLILFSTLGLASCASVQSPAPLRHFGGGEGAGSAGVHSVLHGDTLYSISKRYKIAIRDIVHENALSVPFTLKLGQRLTLPPPQTYRVRAGDNVTAIARIFDVSVNELTRLNGLSAPYSVKPGQDIALPSQAAKVDDAFRGIEEVPPRIAVYRTPVPESKADVRTAQVRPADKARSKRIITRAPARSSSRFLIPVNGQVISRYGPKVGGLHNDGMNIAAPKGAPVSVAENGVVVYVGSALKGSGNLVLVRHADGWMTAYAHLDKTTVTRGAIVKRGMKIGTVGSTGSVSSPQLHFEVRRGTKAINPARYL